MGEFPHRLAIFRMGFGWCDESQSEFVRERAPAICLVPYLRRSERPVREAAPLRIERTNLAARQGLGRIRTRRARHGDRFACRGYVTAHDGMKPQRDQHTL